MILWKESVSGHIGGLHPAAIPKRE